MGNILSIRIPDGLHTWGIEFQSDDNVKIERFVIICRTSLNKNLGAFHQSGITPDGLSDYQYFEFLRMYNTKDWIELELIYEECLKVAEAMNENLINTERFELMFR